MFYEERFHSTSYPYLVKSFLILSKTPTSLHLAAFLIRNNECTLTLGIKFPTFKLCLEFEIY